MQQTILELSEISDSKVLPGGGCSRNNGSWFMKLCAERVEVRNWYAGCPARTGMTSEWGKMLNGERYDSMDSELVAARERARELTREYNQTAPDAHGERRALIEDLLGSLGERCHFEPPFRCDYGSNIHVGEDFYANFDCVILDVCRVDIGRNCQIGPGAHIYTATHSLDATERTDDLEHGKPVTIGDNVWLGGQAVINPGVTIGDNTVVGSGAVVTKDVPSDVVVQGNPASVVKELD